MSVAISKTKSKVKDKAIVSRALQSVGSATSHDIAGKTGIAQARVYQMFVALADGNYVQRGKFTGKRNETYWEFIKLYVEPSDKKVDFDIHYSAFYNLVKVGK